MLSRPKTRLRRLFAAFSFGSSGHRRVEAPAVLVLSLLNQEPLSLEMRSISLNVWLPRRAGLLPATRMRVEHGAEGHGKSTTTVFCLLLGPVCKIHSVVPRDLNGLGPILQAPHTLETINS